MVAKFFKTGTNSASSARAYLLKDPTAKVVRGDLFLTEEIANSITRKWKYTSGVLSFQETDLPEEAKEQIMADFEKTVFAGMEANQFNISWVEHQDKGSLELHFLIPRTELRTGRELTPYLDKLDQNKMRLWADITNAEYQLTSPMESDKRLIAHPVRNLASLRNQTIAHITETVQEQINQGYINDRTEVVEFLKSAGLEITRQGKDSISVKTDPDKKAIKLKGEIYGENFTTGNKLAEGAGEAEKRHIADIRADIQGARGRLEGIIERHTESNRKAYKPKEQEHCVLDDGIHSENTPADARKDHVLNNDKGLLVQNYKRERLKNDRIRNTTTQVIRAGEARQRARDERASRYAQISRKSELTDYRPVEQTIRRNKYRRDAREAIIRLSAKLDSVARSIAHAVAQKIDGIIQMTADQELNKFKQQVNIAELAQSMGYKIDKEKSTRIAPVLSHENGDKVVIGLNRKNGHYIYFSARDDSDNGTVIDFLQNRAKLTLGKVRKICRDWLEHDSKGIQIQKTTIFPSNGDSVKIKGIWERIKSDQFMVDYRGISKDLLNHIIKEGRAKLKDGQLYFQMLDRDGIVGIEKIDTQTNSKHVIAQSEKNLWTYGNIRSADRILIFESAIDALSYRQMNYNDGKDAYVSTQGAYGDRHAESLNLIVQANPKAQFVICTDADQGGERIALSVEKTLQEAQAGTIRKEDPINAKDWNEQLKRVHERTIHRTPSLG